jgi:protochlorophyllide reductase
MAQIFNDEHSSKSVLAVALVAFAGTLIGFATTVHVVSNYTASSTRLGPVRATTIQRADLAGLFSEMLLAKGQVPIPEPVQVPIPEPSSAWLSESLSSSWSVYGAVAAFASVLLWNFTANRQPTVSLANTAGFRQEQKQSTILKAGPLDALFDKRKTVVITGASSGLGLQTARVLADSGKWLVIMACRNVSKGKQTAKELGLKEGSYEVMNLELESFRSVRSFCKDLRAKGRPIDCLVCNAALYLPNQRSPDFTEDGFERCFQVNHLSHYLMIRLLLDDIAKSSHKRIVVVGSITGNSNTVGEGAVLPLADLGKLQGMKAGMQEPISMIDGKTWNGAKAYKDSKVCNMMTIRELHRRYHKQLGITFSTMYPGCIAETALFRQKRGWFRFLFPLFMKYVTGGYVSQEEAGERLAECVDSPETKKSGVYWSWNGGARTIAYFAKTGKGNQVGLTGAGGSGGALFENEPSDLVRDPYTANEMYELSEQLCGLRPDPRAKNAEPALP